MKSSVIPNDPRGWGIGEGGEGDFGCVSSIYETSFSPTILTLTEKKKHFSKQRERFLQFCMQHLETKHWNFTQIWWKSYRDQSFLTCHHQKMAWFVSFRGQGWNQFGMTGVFLSAPRYDWSGPLSHPSSYMLVNHGPSQQVSIEEYKPRKWGATARYYARISYKDYVTNEEVRAKIQQAIGPHEDLLTIVKRRKLKWYGHVSRSSGLAKTILQGKVKGGRRQGRQRKRWEDNASEWTSLEFGKS